MPNLKMFGNIIELNMPIIIMDHIDRAPSLKILIAMQPMTQAPKTPNVFADRPLPNLKANRFIKNKPVKMIESVLSSVILYPRR